MVMVTQATDYKDKNIFIYVVDGKRNNAGIKEWMVVSKVKFIKIQHLL